MNIEKARFNMIEQQIRPWDVLDPVILDLLSVVRREDFVPAEHRDAAFVDTEIPLPGGGAMLPPKLEAKLLQEMAVQRHEKVLLIGAGTGYLAALLSHRALKVVALDAVAEHVELCKANLARAHVAGVDVRHQDGAHGHQNEAPFDAILLAGSVHAVPNTLFDQLKPNGRLLAIVGDAPIMQAMLYTKGPQGTAPAGRAIFDYIAPRLPGFADKPAFSF